jgi:DNA-directed RNA polymerase subunit K/omega
MKPERVGNTSIITRDAAELAKDTDNIYKSVVIISKRARQISVKIKEELSSKLAEFATSVDNLEEVFENREQIEISKFYERMPKPTTMAIEEFLENKVYFNDAEKDAKPEDDDDDYLLAQ